jgi:2-dehydro-3-deoxyphosphogluconate aldolase/(4S)-4-hydroxy-2-oxoglutarate aldolase
MHSNVQSAAPIGRQALPRHIAEPGVIAIGRRLEAGSTLAIADALAQGGLRAFELTLNEPVTGALEELERLASAVGDRMLVGAGTVLSVDAAQHAIDAGARFLVAPHTDASLIGWATERGVPILPGAFTPTEILAAWRAGATAVKLFPASVGGPAAVREIRGPFPDIPLIPTGGVALDSVAAFVTAGAVAVGIGSWLFAEPRLDIVAARAEMVVTAVREARAGVRGGPDAALGDRGWGRSL